MQSSILTKKDILSSVVASTFFMGGGAAVYFLFTGIFFSTQQANNDLGLVLVYPFVLCLLISAYGAGYLACLLMGKFFGQEYINRTYVWFALLTPICLPWIIVGGIASPILILPIAWVSLALIYLIVRQRVLLKKFKN